MYKVDLFVLVKKLKYIRDTKRHQSFRLKVANLLHALANNIMLTFWLENRKLSSERLLKRKV